MSRPYNSNNENQFRKLVEASARKTKGMHLIPIPDDAKRMLVQAPDLAHLVEEKVYDLGVLYKGKYAALELKNVNNSLIFNSNVVKPHQIKYLREAVAAGGMGYVLVRIKRGLTAREKKLLVNAKIIKNNEFAIDKTYAISVEWLHIQEETSFHLEFLQSTCTEVPFDEFTKEYDLKVLWPKKTTSPKKKPASRPPKNSNTTPKQ